MMGTIASVKRLSSSDSDKVVGMITFASSTLKLRWSETELDSLSLDVSLLQFYIFCFSYGTCTFAVHFVPLSLIESS